MMTTHFNREYTRETASRIYHPPVSIVNRIGLNFQPDKRAWHHI